MIFYFGTPTRRAAASHFNKAAARKKEAQKRVGGPTGDITNTKNLKILSYIPSQNLAPNREKKHLFKVEKYLYQNKIGYSPRNSICLHKKYSALTHIIKIHKSNSISLGVQETNCLGYYGQRTIKWGCLEISPLISFLPGLGPKQLPRAQTSKPQQK